MLINKINIQNDILKNNRVFKGQCPVCGSSERKSSEILSDTQKLVSNIFLNMGLILQNF